VRFQEPKPLIQVTHDLDEQVIGAHVMQHFSLVGAARVIWASCAI
jgi:hypothetical protein